MPSWINDERATILRKYRDRYEGSPANELRKLVKDIERELRGTDGEPLPAKIKKVKCAYYILYCQHLSNVCTNNNDRLLVTTSGNHMTHPNT
jgi:hypothetical protein